MEDTLDGLPTFRGGDGKESKLLANRYKIIRKIGEGGMGMVYLAEDMELGNTKVAIKFIPPMLAGNARAVKNLKKEAQTAMQLSHPNIVRLHDLHTDGHQNFLVMEYIEGKTLEEALAEKENDKLSLEELLPIAEQIAAGLDYAHSKNVLHRDLKPSNIMTGKSGTVKLLDFGIAREMKDSFTRVTGQETSGTLPYMSPEQLMGENPSPSMDIYSFGAVLYECLSGHPPFYRGDIRRQIEYKKPEILKEVLEHTNKALQAALAKKASERPSKARVLIRLLEKPNVAKEAEGKHKEVEEKAREQENEIAKKDSIIFEERFNDNVNEWGIELTANHECRISEGKYIFTHNRDKGAWTSWVTIEMDERLNFEIECDVRHVNGINNHGYGIIWGMKDCDNYFSFDISANKYFMYSKIVNSERIDLKPWTRSVHINGSNAFNQLIVRKRDCGITFLINGEIVHTAAFEKFFGNKIGFEISNQQTIEFDNLVVRYIE